MPIERWSLTDQCRGLLMRWVLTPGARPERVDDLAARFEVSRTPVRDAVRKLESIGLVRTTPYRGVEPLFSSRAELRRRILILACAASAGFEPVGDTMSQRVASAVGGDWGAITWQVIAAWPEHAPGWGSDLRPHRDEILQQFAAVECASTPNELATALRAIRDLF